MAAKVSFEMASEYLRLVLPLMSLHKVPVVPLNYAVWYEYGSGGNPALKHSIDHLLEAGEPVDEKATLQRLLIGDIDKFKSVNDNYGHIFGDKIIKVVATAFANLTKGKDLAARFGGEEFIILLPDTDLMGAAAVGESIRKAIENGRVYNPKTGEEIDRVTISIGVTELIHGEPLEDTIARADAALYRAKESGRNRVEINHADSSSKAA